MSSPQPPPPPPPPNPTPPGYQAYEPSYASSVPLRRVRGLRTALFVLLIVCAVATAITVATTPVAVDNAQDFIDGRIDEDTFNDRQAGPLLAQLLAGATTIAIVVLTMIWLFRIASNHRALGRRTTWSPGWAIGGWFLPPVLYVIPTLMVREHWKAADPAVPPGDDRWRQGPEPWLVWLWFVLYSLVPIGLLIAGSRMGFGAFGGDVEDVADAIADTEALSMVSGLVTVASAIVWALVVRALTSRHTDLTGETHR